MQQERRKQMKEYRVYKMNFTVGGQDIFNEPNKTVWDFSDELEEAGKTAPILLGICPTELDAKCVLDKYESSIKRVSTRGGYYRITFYYIEEVGEDANIMIAVEERDNIFKMANLIGVGRAVAYREVQENIEELNIMLSDCEALTGMEERCKDLRQKIDMYETVASDIEKEYARVNTALPLSSKEEEFYEPGSLKKKGMKLSLKLRPSVNNTAKIFNPGNPIASYRELLDGLWTILNEYTRMRLIPGMGEAVPKSPYIKENLHRIVELIYFLKSVSVRIVFKKEDLEGGEYEYYGEDREDI